MAEAGSHMAEAGSHTAEAGSHMAGRTQLRTEAIAFET